MWVFEGPMNIPDGGYATHGYSFHTGTLGFPDADSGHYHAQLLQRKNAQEHLNCC